MECQVRPQLEFIGQPVLALAPGFGEARTHLLPRIGAHQRVMDRVQHAERRDLRRRGRRIEPARRDRHVPGLHDLAGRLLLCAVRGQRECPPPVTAPLAASSPASTEPRIARRECRAPNNLISISSMRQSRRARAAGRRPQRDVPSVVYRARCTMKRPSAATASGPCRRRAVRLSREHCRGDAEPRQHREALQRERRSCRSDRARRPTAAAPTACAKTCAGNAMPRIAPKCARPK